MAKESKYAPFKEALINGTMSINKIAKQLNVSEDAVRMARKKLLHPETFKRNNRAWRTQNADKSNAINRNYRAQTQNNAVKLGDEWTIAEDLAILKGSLKGLDLATALGRTLDAIYIRKHRLRKKGITADSLK